MTSARAIQPRAVSGSNFLEWDLGPAVGWHIRGLHKTANRLAEFSPVVGTDVGLAENAA